MKAVKLNNTWVATSESRKAKNEKSDCGVRAIAAATGSDYDKAHAFAKDVLGRKDRNGTYIRLFKEDKVKARIKKDFGFTVEGLHKPAKREFWKTKNGIEKRKPAKGIKAEPVWKDVPAAMYTSYKDSVARMTLTTFLELYPKGIYLVTVTKHCFTIIDGVVHGNEEDATKLKVRIHQAWEFKKVAKRKARRKPAAKKVTKKAPRIFRQIAAI